MTQSKEASARIKINKGDEDGEVDDNDECK